MFKKHPWLHVNNQDILACLASGYGTDKSCNGYTHLYESYFNSRREEPLRILELGIGQPCGPSLQLWYSYFPNAQIFGIDANPACQQVANERISVYSGDLMNDGFMQSFLQQSQGQFDIIIDDAGHAQPQLSHSLNQLWPHLNHGGVYIIEDLCTSYGSSFGGGYRKPGTMIEELKGLVDTLHVDTYKTTPLSQVMAGPLGLTPTNQPLTEFEKSLYTIHFYQGICFMFKGVRRDG